MIDTPFKVSAVMGLAGALETLTSRQIYGEYWIAQDVAELDLQAIRYKDGYYRLPAFLWNAYLLALEEDSKDKSKYGPILQRATQHHFARQVLALISEPGTIKP